MISAYRVTVPRPRLSGAVILEPSKSLSNRALIIQSLCETPFEIHHLSTSDDTRALQGMLSSVGEILHSGHAGSSYRFMVARACLGDREITLDASEQLRRRPIGPLVRALQKLGADISYLKKDGFPPLRIKAVTNLGVNESEITLHAGVSSQYISALLMIAPSLPKGLTIHLEDEPVSEAYIHMTLQMMAYFGVSHSWENKTIRIEPGKYVGKDITIEGDWSAASYYYSIAALSETATFDIQGLSEVSFQGDQVVKSIYADFGIETQFTETGIKIIKEKVAIPYREFAFDFTSCPDLAQTVMVTLAGLGFTGKLKGLTTLRIKETDRLSAMQTELARVKTKVEINEKDGKLSCLQTGKAKWKDRGNFNTYDDHRMAMAFTPLACLNPIIIKSPEVVTKSYPGFWKDIEQLGVKIESIRVK